MTRQNKSGGIAPKQRGKNPSTTKKLLLSKALGHQQSTVLGKTNLSLRAHIREGEEDVHKHFKETPSTDVKGHKA
jgi:hypothetical protein